MKTEIVKLNYLKIAPRKVRLVANTLKGLYVNEAEAQLLIMPQKSSGPLLKLLRSAVANAKNNKQINAENLFIKEIRVDQGPIRKSWMPRAYGRATPIHKKTSHVTLVLSESEKTKQPRFKIVKPKKIKKIDAEKITKEKVKKEQKEKKETKSTKGPGFMKKMFRRKSI